MSRILYSVYIIINTCGIFVADDVLYSDANPVDYEEDFIPILPNNAMTDQDKDLIFVNPPPESAPHSPKPSEVRQRSNSGRPQSINENASQENEESDPSIHGMSD